MTAGPAENQGRAPGRPFYLALAAMLLAVTGLFLAYSLREYYSGSAADPDEFPAPPEEAMAGSAADGSFRGGIARTAYYPSWQGGDGSPVNIWQTRNANPVGVDISPVVADGVLYMVTSVDDYEIDEFKSSEGRVTVAYADERIYSDEVLALEAIDIETRQVRWVYMLSERDPTVRSGPAPTVDNGTVYTGTGDSGCVLAIDADSVKEKWRFCVAGSPEAGYFPIDTPPAVSEGAVYVGASDGNLYALDAATGAERWRFQTGERIRVAPAIYGGIVYFGTGDEGADPNLYAVNQATGQEVWHFHTAGTVTATAAVADGVVYFQSTDHNLYAVDAASGSLLWRYDTGYAGFSSPAVARGKVFTNRLSDENGHAWVVALDAGDGSTQWETDLKRNYTNPLIVAGGSVLVGSSGEIFFIDARNGKIQWQSSGKSYGTSSPTVDENTLYTGGLRVSAWQPQP